jgi:hypothetical protein
MKFVLVPVFMLLMLAQTFSKWFVVIEYKLNKDFIAKNLCINKAKPKLHCNGKCQMMKKLAEEEKQNSSNNTNNTTKNNLLQLVFSTKMNTPVLPLLTYVTVCYNEEPPLLKHDSPIGFIFHPPALG